MEISAFVRGLQKKSKKNGNGTKEARVKVRREPMSPAKPDCLRKGTTGWDESTEALLSSQTSAAPPPLPPLHPPATTGAEELQ